MNENCQRLVGTLRSLPKDFIFDFSEPFAHIDCNGITHGCAMVLVNILWPEAKPASNTGNYLSRFLGISPQDSDATFLPSVYSDGEISTCEKIYGVKRWKEVTAEAVAKRLGSLG